MDFKPEKEKRKQKYLLLFFILIIITTVLVWYFGFGKKEESGSLTGSVFSRFRAINIDFDLLKSPEFKGLQQFREIIPFGGIKGRENPFLPY